MFGTAVMDPSSARRQLDKLAASSHFASAPRLYKFLRYVVEAKLGGEFGRLCQTQIANDVFGRHDHFDPAIDSVVRVEAARLRTKLRDYYDSDGREDLIRFELPKGGYIPEIHQSSDPAVGQRLSEVAAPDPQEPALAVLPFLNMSEDPGQEYFADGITEDLITDLAKVPGLLVFARHTTFQYKGMGAAVGRVKEELGATHVLEGSVRRSGNRIRITAQLIDAKTEFHLWADRYDRPLNDIFAVQDEVVRNIVDALAINLAHPGKPRTSARDEVVKAYDLVLQGYENAMLYSREANARATELYRQALKLDPQYAVAYARLAIAEDYQGMMGWSASSLASFRSALEFAKQAVLHGPELPLAHGVLAWTYHWLGEGERAANTAKKAIALGPSDASAHLFCSLCLILSGHAEEGLAVLEKARRIDPFDPFYFPRGLANFHMGRFEEALELFKCSIARFPEFMPSRINMAACCGHLGLREEGRKQYEVVRKMAPTHVIGIFAQSGHVMVGLRKLQGID